MQQSEEVKTGIINAITSLIDNFNKKEINSTPFIINDNNDELLNLIKTDNYNLSITRFSKRITRDNYNGIIFDGSFDILLKAKENNLQKKFIIESSDKLLNLFYIPEGHVASLEGYKNIILHDGDDIQITGKFKFYISKEKEVLNNNN